MRRTTNHAPTDAHNLQTTAAAALAVVTLLVAAVATAAAPLTAFTVAGTTVAVLGTQRLITAYRTWARERTREVTSP